MSVTRPLTAHSRIDLHDPEELAFWCGFFDVSEDQLHAAIAEVGPFVATLDGYFETGSSQAA